MNSSAISKVVFSASLLFLTQLQGCLQTAPVVNISALKAPEFEEALKYKVYTVRPFSGANGGQITRDIDVALASNRISEQALVKTVPYDTYMQSVSRARPGVPAIASPVDAVITGEVISSAWTDQAQNRTEQECAVQSDKKNFLGLKACAQFRDVTRYCTKRSASYSVAIRVSDARDQRTVWGNTISETVENTVCQNDGRALSDGPVMLGTAYTAVMARVRSALIATEQKLAVKLIEEPDNLGPAEQAQYKGSLAFAKAGRMDRACDQFVELFEKNKQSVGLTYSMAVCQESRGRLWEAVELYKTADSLTTSPNPTITEALTRVSANVRDSNKVRGIATTGAATAAAAAPRTQSVADQKLTGAQKAQVQGEHRIALVIGNSRYTNIAALRNPVNDAQDMEAALKQKGFEVIRVSDGTREQITQAVRSFELKIRENSTVLVFYAGHGVQSRGINYLIPVDARIQSGADLSTEAIDMDLSIMRRLEDRNPRLSIIILDACRNNPFPAGARSAGEQPGLASVSAPRGSIVAFSTAPNKTAQDGSGRNGLYTKYLLRELQVPNRKIEDVFKRVRENVMKESTNGQTPWENSALTGDFYFSVSQ